MGMLVIESFWELHSHTSLVAWCLIQISYCPLSEVHLNWLYAHL